MSPANMRNGQRTETSAPAFDTAVVMSDPGL